MLSVKDQLHELREVAQRCEAIIPDIEKFLPSVIETLKNGGRILTCGNGGSAADSLHLAQEFVGRYRTNRQAFSAISLVADATALTCIGNDWDYETIFSRQVEAHGRAGDFFVCFTTSGNSPNIVKAIDVAKKMNITTLALLGKTGGKCKDKADFEVIVPSDSTARIQEIHGWILHVILEAVEAVYHV
ncbi:MAG: D-sedoheptulose-7-phosphate isomerase [Verrucomicrobiota bacterium]